MPRDQDRHYQSRHHRERDRSSSHERRRRRNSNSPSPHRQTHSRRHSRSRSRQKEFNRSQSQPGVYEERKQEEMEHQVRLAIRNNEIQFDTKSLEIFNSMSPRKQQQITQQAQSVQKINECILVRQLYVSGLSDMNEGFIKNIMGKYGQIESIEILKNFAFVKFYRVEDASNACADYHTINLTLHSTHNPNFKIFFADHLKRWNVVSNHPRYEQRDMLIPVIYASVKNDTQIANEDYLKNVFNKYGFIRNLQIHRNQLPGPKIYSVIEYQTITQALRAREMLKNQKQKLGDRRSQIALLIDTDKITRQFPNVNNQLRYQRKRLQTTQMMNMYGNTTSNAMMPSITSNTTTNPQVSQQTAEDVMEMINRITGQPNLDAQLQHQQPDWAGFLMRNKIYKVEVDLITIHKVSLDLQSILNITHRGDCFQALERKDLLEAGRVKAANSLNENSFAEYIRYFIKKRRAGVIQSKYYLIYLLPPMVELNLPYPISQNEMLAMIFNSPVGQIRLP